ncbi:MAG: nicotinamide-nucleotide amidohydrolase family protein [Clostridia bacterium]|nr:nicotinamide-nucleotide amidohydrolase family protein [Clostridia bacterium]
MKSTYIYYNGSNINNATLINTLITTLGGEVLAIPADCENLIKVIKNCVYNSNNIFISREFANPNTFNLLSKKIFKNYEFADYNESAGIFSIYKNKKIAFLPNNLNNIIGFLNKYFNIESNTFGNDVCFGKIKVANLNTELIKKTLSEFEGLNNPIINVTKNNLYSEVLITTFNNQDYTAQELYDNTNNKIKMLLGDDVFATTETEIQNTVVNLLLKNNIKIASAESCTGGMFSKLITAVPNSSQIFEIGITSYSNRIKQQALAVPKNILKDYGAVSKQTAAHMALGILKLSGAEIGIGITGVAGPTTSEGKSVGTVYISLTNGNYFWTRKLELGNITREEIREAAAFAALDLTRRYLECLPIVLPNYSTNINEINCLYEQPHYINSSLIFLDNNLENIINVNTSPTPDFLNFTGTNEKSNALKSLEKTVIKKQAKAKRAEQIKSDFSLKLIIENLKITANYKDFLFNSFVKTCFILLMCCSVIFATSIFFNFYINYTDTKDLNNIRAEFNINSPDFSKLLSINNNITGWVNINSTNINNPICNYIENDYYKTHNYKNKTSNLGSLYFAKNCLPETAKNIVIYGNNLNNDNMFSDLLKYKQKSFADSAQVIDFVTNNNIHQKYLIFAVIIASSNSSSENDYFNYSKTDFSNITDFSKWITEVKFRSIYDCSIPTNFTDNYLTLVTDSNEFSGAKTVVIARAISDSDNILNGYPLTVNSAPKYPSIWYKLHNSVDPYNK